MTATEIKPFLNQLCTVKYGTKVSVTGTILKAADGHLHVKEIIGEYSIPLEQVTSVKLVS